MTRRGGLLAVLALLACGRADTASPATPAPPLVLVGLDGFRHDYLDRAPAVHLRRLAAAGVRAERLVPVFPTKTFPALYSIVTGLTPDRHGIVANVMEDPALGRFRISDSTAVGDPRWWGGEPIWVTAIRQGRPAAAMFWPGSEAPIAGVRPTEWHRFDGTLPYAERVDRVLEWLARPPGRVPAIAMLYLEGVDAAGHRHGPDAPATDAAIAEVDRAVGRLLDGLDRLGPAGRVNLLVVSDHGMTGIDPARVVYLDDYVDTAAAAVVDLGPVTTLAPAAGRLAEVRERLRGAHPALTVYRREDLPAAWRFGTHPRIPPLVAVASPGWSVALRGRGPPADRGNHGYDPAADAMGGILVAAGPAFPAGRRAPPVQAIHLYELMAALMRIEPAPGEGRLDSIPAVLRPGRSVRESSASGSGP
jgi:predicted AlkP superfamily pyrophosphatase or phosphodiesterase